MRFQTRFAFRVSEIKNGSPFLSQFQASRLFCHHHQPEKHKKGSSSFGIAFDIDGVILRGRVPVGGSPLALKRLFGENGSLKVPFVFLTNGGGIPESKRAIELSDLLGVKILPSQVLQGHSPFKNLLKRYENELIVATGKGEPGYVMSEYGFKYGPTLNVFCSNNPACSSNHLFNFARKVLSIDEYASLFENIDPVSQYKKWTANKVSNRTNKASMEPRFNFASEEAVKAVFVVSDPVDWGRDIQVICDILRSGGLPGQENGHQPPLYFAADDLEYQAAFPSKRLGMGAFRIALESIFNRIHHDTLKYTTFGKPNPSAFKNAQAVLNQLHPSNHKECGSPGSFPLNTLYMIGDNPWVDIKGAQKAGNPWFSILTRTGVFRGEHNDAEFPANMVVDTVEEAVEYILQREREYISL